MLKTKSILKPFKKSDGTRISVMSRHTLNDGVTPDQRISSESYDLWMPSLAPPTKLLGDYYRRGLSWSEFEKEYLQYIRQPNNQKEIQELAKKSLTSTITLLCIEDFPKQCHRRILAEECKNYQPNLSLNIK